MSSKPASKEKPCENSDARTTDETKHPPEGWPVGRRLGDAMAVALAYALTRSAHQVGQQAALPRDGGLAGGSRRRLGRLADELHGAGVDQRAEEGNLAKRGQDRERGPSASMKVLS